MLQLISLIFVFFQPDWSRMLGEHLVSIQLSGGSIEVLGFYYHKKIFFKVDV